MRIASAPIIDSSTAANDMEQCHLRSLEDLHRRLMEDVRSDKDGIAEELEAAIENLGVYTQEILTNEEESADRMETPLSAACRLAKPLTVSQLLHLQAIPTLRVYQSLLTNVKRDSRPLIASSLLMFTKPSVRLRVLWLACIFNEIEIAKLCLLNPYVDSNVKMDLGFDRTLSKTWRFSEAPLPIQYAASRNHVELLQVLEGYLDEDKHAADDSYVDYLLIAAYSRHQALAEQILCRRRATAAQYARIDDIIGASEIVINNPARGKTFWKRAILVLESSGSYRSRLANDILSLEPAYQDFRTPEEIDSMRAKELRVQALSIMRKHFGDSFVFAHALVRRDYSKRISVFALRYIASQDRMSAGNLKLLENSLDQLKFFLFPERDLVMECLRWCVDFVGQLRSLLEIQPTCNADLERLVVLVDFTCKVLLTVEILECPTFCDNKGEHCKAELQHLLRRVIAVFQPLNEKCCLLERLEIMRQSRPRIENTSIFKVLSDAAADLILTDDAGNVTRDFAERFRHDEVSEPAFKKRAGNEPFTVMREH